jgi:phosphoglycolate phosphatase-like HAD superfamily hydrolase
MFSRSLTNMIVCDMGGTIIQESGIFYKSLYESIKIFKPDLKITEIYDLSKYNKNDIIKYFIKDVTTYRRTSLIFNKKLYKNYNDDSIKLINPDIPDFFNDLRKDNIKITLNTDYNKKIQELLINKFNLQNYIDDYISTSEVIKGRPSPVMMCKLMDRNNILQTNHIIKIGDTRLDILEGKNTDCKTVGVLSGMDTLEELNKENPDFIVDNIINIKFF